MSVSVENRDGAHRYTWQGARFTWSSTTAKKPWTRMYNNILTLKVDEDISLQIVAARCFDRLFEESIGVQSNLLGREILKGVVEEIRADERLKKEAKKTFKESVNIVDNNAKLVEKYFEDEFALKDSVARSVGKVISENVTLNEDFKRFVTFSRNFLEAVCVVEGLKKFFEKRRDEDASISDGIAKTGRKNITETISAEEILERKAIFKRTFEETITAVEKLSKKFGKPVQEVLAVVDAYLRNANAALSDFYISTDDLSYEEFLKINSPVGYEPFRDFLIGDYEYKEALFRVMLNGPLTEGRPLITNWTLNVDVPDICDRGTCVVPAAGKRIDFTKRYYAVPEVNVIVRAGANGVPDYTVDDKGFDVIVYGPDGQPISATISWSAIGY